MSAKTALQLLFGRWHVDRENTLNDDYGLEGAFEVAGLTKRPMQQAVRGSSRMDTEF